MLNALNRSVWCLGLLVVGGGFTATAAAQKPAQAYKDSSLAARVAHVRTLLRTSPLVDGHNDLPWALREEKETPRDVEAYNLRRQTRGMTDIARLRKGQVGGQFWSVYIPGEIRDSGYARVQLEQIDIAKRIIAKYPDVFQPAYTAADVKKAYRQGKIGSLLGMEGGHAIENSLGALRAYYDLGARYMTLTHNVTLDWADAANDKAVHGGLTPFGQEVVREMNRLGMLVDLSHVSPGVMSASHEAVMYTARTKRQPAGARRSCTSAARSAQMQLESTHVSLFTPLAVAMVILPIPPAAPAKNVLSLIPAPDVS
jgi:membrane dipeptidase